MSDKPKCFVMMPISTPDSYINDGFKPDHFRNIFTHLHSPAIKKAGYEVVSPVSQGSEIIHGEIIQKISKSDLVLCDMSWLNPNVFFEFGIRCALNKPVVLVIDDKTEKIPFDINMINRQTYQSNPGYKVEEEIEKISKHIIESVTKSDNQNSLWKRFGISIVGKFEPEKVDTDDKLEYIIDLLITQNRNISLRLGNSNKTHMDEDEWLKSMTIDEILALYELSSDDMADLLNDKFGYIKPKEQQIRLYEIQLYLDEVLERFNNLDTL